MTSQTPAREHRPDIQALRALAVTAVVLYHLWPGLVPGGYVGVDVFFVISGFLITGLLVPRAAKPPVVSICWRSTRGRIRRLLPAALAGARHFAGGAGPLHAAAWSGAATSRRSEQRRSTRRTGQLVDPAGRLLRRAARPHAGAALLVPEPRGAVLPGVADRARRGAWLPARWVDSAPSGVASRSSSRPSVCSPSWSACHAPPEPNVAFFSHPGPGMGVRPRWPGRPVADAGRPASCGTDARGDRRPGGAGPIPRPVGRVRISRVAHRHPDDRVPRSSSRSAAVLASVVAFSAWAPVAVDR